MMWHAGCVLRHDLRTLALQEIMLRQTAKTHSYYMCLLYGGD